MYGTARRRRARVSHGGVAGRADLSPRLPRRAGRWRRRGEVVVCLQHGLLGRSSPYVCVHSGGMGWRFCATANKNATRRWRF